MVAELKSEGMPGLEFLNELATFSHEICFRKNPGVLALTKRCPSPESDSPARVELKSTKSVLAAEPGTVSETFSRTLGKFREQKLINVKGKTVTVLSPKRLNALLRRNLGE